MQIPEPPSLTKCARTTSEVIDLARRLQTSGLLKLDWDPEKHPRWPAGSSGSVGGKFAPTGNETENSTSEDSGAALTNAYWDEFLRIAAAIAPAHTKLSRKTRRKK
jgi:hypothetical protein